MVAGNRDEKSLQTTTAAAMAYKIDERKSVTTETISTLACDVNDEKSCRIESTDAAELMTDRFDGDDDPANPRNWSKRKKWSIVASLSIMSLAGCLATIMCAPAMPQIRATLQSNNELLGTLIVTMWELGEGVGPLLFAPLSETFGRQVTFNGANIGFVVFNVLVTVSVNEPMLVAMRFLNGVALATVTLNPCIVGDMFNEEERGTPMALINLLPLLGPTAGPIVGGYLANSAGWRWVFGFTAIFAAVASLTFALVYRETYRPVILRRKAKEALALGNRGVTGQSASGSRTALSLKNAFTRPITLLLFHPMVTCLALYYSVLYGYFYILMTTLSALFEDRYNFGDGEVGLTYLGLGVGICFSVFTCVITLGLIVKANKAAGRETTPEHRLPMLIGGSVAVMAGLFLYGWSAEKGLFWIAPIIGTALVGFGMVGASISVNTYLADAFPLHAASSMAAIGILRSIAAAALPLVGPPLYSALGLGWGNSLLGFVAAAGIPMSIFLMLCGKRIRSSSRLTSQ